LAVREGWLGSGRRSRQTNQWVDHLGGVVIILGGTNLGLSPFLPGARRKQSLRSPGPSPRSGNGPSSLPITFPLTPATVSPATGGLLLRTHGPAGHSFLWPPPPLCAHAHAPNRDRRPAAAARPPQPPRGALPRGWRNTDSGESFTPPFSTIWIIRTRPPYFRLYRFASQEDPGKRHPPVFWIPKNFISKIWPVGGALLGQFKHFTGPPVLSPWVAVCGPWRGCEWPSAPQIYRSGGRSGGAVQGGGALGSRGRPGEGRQNPVRISSCLLLLASAPSGPTPLALVYVGNRTPRDSPLPKSM